MKILLVKPSEYPEVKDIPGDLKSMQKLVDGLIQAIYPFPEPVALICNDEGKLIGLPMNRAIPEIRDVICGDFFLCSALANSSEFTSLTDDQIAQFEERFHYSEVFLPLDNESYLTVRVS